MVSEQKLHLFTIQQQKILLKIHENANSIVYKDQKIYKANGSFKEAMKPLVNAGFIRIIRPNGNRGCNLYKLTLDGIFLVEDVIKHFVRSNKTDG